MISRSVGKYVTELLEENKKPIHFQEASSSTGKLGAMKQKEQVIPSSSSSTALLINPRTWNDITRRRVDWLLLLHNIGADDQTLTTSRLSSRRRWSNWMEKVVYRCFYPDFPAVKTWPKQSWLNHLEKASNKKRLQYCSDSYGDILYMRAFSRPLWRKQSWSLQDNVEIRYKGVGFIYHVGSSHDIETLFSKSSLIPGAKDSKDGKPCSSLQWIPWTNHKRRYVTGRSGKCTRPQYLGPTWKVLKTED